MNFHPFIDWLWEDNDDDTEDLSIDQTDGENNPIRWPFNSKEEGVMSC